MHLKCSSPQQTLADKWHQFARFPTVQCTGWLTGHEYNSGPLSKMVCGVMPASDMSGFSHVVHNYIFYLDLSSLGGASAFPRSKTDLKGFLLYF